MTRKPWGRRLSKARRWGGWLGVLLLLAAAVYAAAYAPAPALAVEGDSGYSVPWWTVNSGGGSSSGGGYILAGTAGQPVVAVAAGGGYTLRAGFWRGAPVQPPAVETHLYLPLTTR